MMEEHEAHRYFGGIEYEVDLVKSSERQTDSFNQDLTLLINDDIVGNYQPFITPFGKKPIVYADWTASGRSLKRIEDYMRNIILPFYGNTHTSTSITGLQSTSFRQEARQIIAQAVNARITGKANVDVVLFSGNGVTGCISKLITSLGLHIPIPEHLMSDVSFKPVVFTSSYEHHSNLISWRDAGVEVRIIPYHKVTGVCLDTLNKELQLFSNRKLKIGSFSACSNVTGILTAVDAVAVIIHRHNGLVFFDYATAAPYVEVNVNPVGCEDLFRIKELSHHTANKICIADTFSEADRVFLYKDAVCLSVHKFVGGPGSPGVLIVKKELLPSAKQGPTEPGGGTVFYVTKSHHRYLSNPVEREEAGTPNIVSDIRAGLVLQMKHSIQRALQNSVPPQDSPYVNASEKFGLEQREIYVSRYIQEKLEGIPNLVLLGRSPMSEFGGAQYSPRHIPIFSFLVRYSDKFNDKTQKFLHYNFVCALLNDLFGIQTRGGCSCAGPFSQELLGIESSGGIGADSNVVKGGDANLNERFESALLDKKEVLRPGYTRLSFTYWMHGAEEIVEGSQSSVEGSDVEYIINALKFICAHGWKFLHVYKFNNKTGEWAHTSRLMKFPTRLWLSSITDSVPVSNAVSSASGSLLQNTLESSWNEVCNSGTVKKNLSLVQKFILGSAHEELNKIDGVLQTLASRGKGHDKTHGVTNATEEEFESLRWFVLLDDIDLASMYGVSKAGAALSSRKDSQQVIRPHLWMTGENPTVQRTQPMGNAYIRVRNEKLAAHQGGGVVVNGSWEGVIPRFLYSREFGGILPIEGISPDTVREHKSSNEIVTHAAHILPVAPAPVANAPVITDTEMVCASGTCFLKARDVKSEVPAAIPTPTVRKIPPPPKKIMKLVGQAIKDWNMIQEGDRLLLGLSGGKDSLTLLQVLLAVQKRSPVKFELACATVDPQTESFDPSALKPYMATLEGYPTRGPPQKLQYHYLSEPIIALAKEKLQGDSLCAFCARFKRGLLYQCCREFKYNKLVLAQHLDDLAESFLMGILHNGQIRTMKANYPITADDGIQVIRPFVYVREHVTRDYSKTAALPVINENCPACFEQPKERARIKALLAQEEVLVPALFHNLRRALVPLMDNDIYRQFEMVRDRVEKGGNSEADADLGVPNGSIVENEDDFSADYQLVQRNDRSEHQDKKQKLK